MKKLLSIALALACITASVVTYAQKTPSHKQSDKQIQQLRANLTQRIPQLRNIEEITPTPIPGIFELRLNGNEILYTDAKGDHLIDGQLIDTRSVRNLTEERIQKLSALRFDQLPLADAITIVRGTGERKLAIFEDPNCGYCKRFERDLKTVDNVTIYLFLFPVLGPGSLEQSKAVWCAKDREAAWLDLMLRDQSPAAADASCDSSALLRNMEFGRKAKITATPTVVFANGVVKPGAIPAATLEKLLLENKAH